MRKIWNRYRDTVIRNCKDPAAEPFGVEYWRNELFITAVLYMIPLSVIAIVPGVYMALISEFHLLIAADLVAVISLGLIAFHPSISLKIRKLMLFFSIYLVSIVLLYYMGSFGPGLLYLLATTIFVILLLNFKYGLISVGINTVICIIFGVLIYYDAGTGRLISDYNTDSWIAVSSNLLFLCAISVLLIPRLFEGLERAFQNQKTAEAKLKLNQAELRQSLIKLEEKNSELEEFAYTASHDLKEPLRMINSFMQLLKKKYGESLDEKANTYINFAVDGSRRMNQLIDDLLQYSRLGRIHTEIRSVNLNDVVQKVLIPHRPKIESGEWKFTAGQLPVIRAVPVSVELLFGNLISNAYKYRREGATPEVKISCTESDAFWTFEIEDNGIGIDEEYHDQVFQIFYRLHSTHYISGTGIGLAICRKVVKQHGGEIKVVSKPGYGSKFIFSLSKQQVHEYIESE